MNKSNNPVLVDRFLNQHRVDVFFPAIRRYVSYFVSEIIFN